MYAVNEGVEWLILTNGSQWQVYRLIAGLPVTIDMVIRNLTTNAGNAKKLLKLILERTGKERGCGCAEASKYAIITSQDKRDRAQSKKLKAILPDYF